MGLKSDDLFLFYQAKKFLWKDHRGDREEQNGEDKSAKRSKFWTVHSWVGRIILINITLV